MSVKGGPSMSVTRSDPVVKKGLCFPLSLFFSLCSLWICMCMYMKFYFEKSTFRARPYCEWGGRGRSTGSSRQFVDMWGF